MVQHPFVHVPSRMQKPPNTLNTQASPYDHWQDRPGMVQHPFGIVPSRMQTPRLFRSSGPSCSAHKSPYGPLAESSRYGAASIRNCSDKHADAPLSDGISAPLCSKHKWPMLLCHSPPSGWSSIACVAHAIVQRGACANSNFICRSVRVCMCARACSL